MENNVAELIISVSGLRGIVGETLTPEIAVRYVQAFAAGLEDGPLVISQDGRATGPALAAAIRDGLFAAGRDVIDASVAATPTTGILVREHSAAGGIQISASHNPAEYNGLKLFGADGRVVPASVGQQVLDRYRSESCLFSESTRTPSSSPCEDTTTAHWEKIAAQVDVDRIRAARISVLLDANHGSGALLGVRLLEELHCDVTLLGGVPDGQFDHQPEPTAENLSEVLDTLIGSQAAIGFCQDPDADRLAVIDEWGHYIGEEYTLALCTDHLLRKSKGPVVTNCSTSRMTQDVAARFGVAFSRSAVGEANVADEMLRVGAVIGGEGNGGVIHPEIGYVRDSFIAMAMLLDAMAARQLPISRLTEELPHYVMSKQKVPLEREQLADVMARVQSHFGDAEVSALDGLRFDWPGKWVLVRASNTEPIIRIMSEAETAGEADRLCQEVEHLIGEDSA
ncbi:MAG: phosphoglucosamine mutase [Pirellulales bacterium]|nr:phosphoglucosamine mutase [Pirellulales bacterium]